MKLHTLSPGDSGGAHFLARETATGQRGRGARVGGGPVEWQSPLLKPAATRGTSEGSLLGDPTS